jgi:hypothetical protein
VRQASSLSKFERHIFLSSWPNLVVMDNIYKQIKMLLVHSLLLSSLLLACKASDSCPQLPQQESLVTHKKGPRKIYVPEYYVYRNGKYEFIKGHYRWVLNNKAYVKRSLKGYNNSDEASAR